MVPAHTASCLLCFVHYRTLTCLPLCVCEFAVRFHDTGNEMVEVVESGASYDFLFTSINKTSEAWIRSQI
jgi:hypothetical protein